jgi:hypothetical protein
MPIEVEKKNKGSKEEKKLKRGGGVDQSRIKEVC